MRLVIDTNVMVAAIRSHTGAYDQADAIVTFNRRHFVAVTQRFGMAVLSPAAAVNRPEKKS